MLPSADAADLLALTREIAAHELAPVASEFEAAARFPREKFRLLGKAGLLGLPYPERWGGAEQPYEVYLQVLEELATAWMTIGVGLSVHTMACYPLATFGAEGQRDEQERGAEDRVHPARFWPDCGWAAILAKVSGGQAALTGGKRRPPVLR